jgi:hypothetical protein
MVKEPGCGYPHLTRIGLLWGALNSLIGLGFCLLSLTVPRARDGLLVGRSGRGLAYVFLTRRGFGAITFGRVVVSAIPISDDLLMHESHHARQYEVFGPFYLPIYLWLHWRHGYAENPLETEAAACAAAWRARST